MQTDMLNRLKCGNATPSDLKAILLAARNPQQQDFMILQSEGHIEAAQPGHVSTGTMVHQAVERLIQLRDPEMGTVNQQCLIRVQPVVMGQSCAKRARPNREEFGKPYLKNVTFGGRGNFLPAEAPVIFKRSLIVPLMKEGPGKVPHILAKFKVDEVKLVDAREMGACRAIPVLGVECLRPKGGPTSKPTLVFTAKEHHDLHPGSSCITMLAGPEEQYTAPIDTVQRDALPGNFTVRGYLDNAAAQRVANYLNSLAQQSHSTNVWEKYRVERNQPYLYCVTLVEGSHTTSAAMGSEAAPFQRHPGQQAAAAGAEGYSYPPQLPLGTATAIYGCNIPCMASSAGLATMGVTQAAVEHTSGLARVIEVGCAPGAWQSHDGMAGIGSGGGGRGGSGGSSGASAGPRQTNQHGEYSSLSVGSGILPGCKFLAGTQPSFEVEGAALFRGNVALGRLEGDTAAFSRELSTRHITTASITGELRAVTLAASEAEVSGTLRCCTINELSDERYKKNIERLQANALDQVMQLEMYTYSLRDDLTGEGHTGFLAQQLRNVIPSAVVERNGRLHIKPTCLTTFLAKAVQELCIESRRQWAVIFAAIYNLQARISGASASGPHQHAAISDWRMEPDQLVYEEEDEVAGAMVMLADAGVDLSRGGAIRDSSGSAQGLGGSRPAKTNPLADLSVPAAIQHLKAALGEENSDVEGLYRKLLADLDRDEVYDAVQQALKSRGLTASGEPRTVGGEFIQLCRGRVTTKKSRARTLSSALIERGDAAPCKLRQYQQRALGRLAAGENLVLVYPTGGGKTEVALQHTLALLRADPSAKTAMLVPNIALAYQQAGYFQREQSSQTSGSKWRLRVACFNSDNPLAPREWQAALDSHDVIVATGQTLLNALAAGTDRLADIRFLVFDEYHHAKLEHPYSVILKEHYDRLHQGARNNLQILGMTAIPAGHISESKTEMDWKLLADRINGSYEIVDFDDPEVRLHVPRAEERQPIIVQPLQKDLAFSSNTCAAMRQSLDELRLQTSGFSGPPLSIQGELSKAAFSPALQSWITGILEPTHATAKRIVQYVPLGLSEDFACCLRLIAACNDALSVREEAGHKAGIDYIGRAFMHITECSSLATKTSLKGTRWTAWKRLVGRLHEACGQPLQEICVDDATLMTSFPKFCALRAILVECCEEQSDFHGMVFVRTRMGLYLVEKALRAEASLGSISFSRLIGKGTGGGPVAVSTARSMSGKEQARVLEAFRKPGGRKVLLATDAGLEGLDVPDCNFCVRYNASQTAIERVQSRGRTRKAAAEFIEIFENCSRDAKFQQKAYLEEHNMAHIAKRFSSMQI